jgi:hypothetical protein
MAYLYILIALIVGLALGGAVSQEVRPADTRPGDLRLWAGFAVVAVVVGSCIAAVGWLNQSVPASNLVKLLSVAAVFAGFVAAMYIGRRLS